MKSKLIKSQIEMLNRHWSSGTIGKTYAGTMFSGLAEGICCSFVSDVLVAEAVVGAVVRSRLVAASAGADLAAPINYFVGNHNLRLRVGSTTAAAVPATSGIKTRITENTDARGLLRMGLADVVAAAQITLDQGGTLPIDMLGDWSLAYNIANWSNSSTVAAAAGAEFGVVGAAPDLSPANAIAAAFLVVRLAADTISLVDETGVLVSQSSPGTPMKLEFLYGTDARVCTVFVNGRVLGTKTFATSVTAMEIGGRVYHKAAYVVATHAPITVDLDDVLFVTPLDR